MKKTPLKKVSTKQKVRNKNCSDYKKYLASTITLCPLCLKPINGTGDLIHIIRRSYSQELYDNPRNMLFGHRECHSLFDDHVTEASRLPGFWNVLKTMKELDERYYLRYISRIND